MLPVSTRHEKIRRKAFCFLLCCSLIFPVMAVAGSVPAAALWYEFSRVSLYEAPYTIGREEYDRYKYSVFVNSSDPSNIQKLSYSSSYINFFNASDRTWIVPTVNPSWLTTGKRQSTVVLDSSYSTGNNYKISLQQYDTFAFYNLHLKYDGIVPKSNSVYKISVDYSTFISPNSSLQSLLDSGYYGPENMVEFLYDNQLGSPTLSDPSLVTVQNINSGGRKRLTFYFEFPFEYFNISPFDPSDYSSGQTLSMLLNYQVMVNPRYVTNTDYVTYDFYGNFPVSYQILSNSEYGEELDQINRSVEELGGRIENSIEGQTRVILDGINDTLVNDRDPENDEKISEMASKQAEVSDVMSDYDRFHSRIKQAAQSELSVPDYLGLDPEGGFADMIGQIVSLPLFLGIIPVGLFFGLLKILFGTGG